MANKNSKQRKAAFIKASKKAGFPKPVFKARTRHYPRPNQDEDLSLRTQRQIFLGASFKN